MNLLPKCENCKFSIKVEKYTNFRKCSLISNNVPNMQNHELFDDSKLILVDESFSADAYVGINYKCKHHKYKLFGK